MAPSTSKAILRLIAVLFFTGGLGVIGWSAQKNVRITDAGKTVTQQTFALRVRDVLASSGIQLHPGDRIVPQPSQWLMDGEEIVIQRAGQILVQADGKTSLLVSTERRPANLLHMLGIPLFPEDKVLVDGLLVSPAESLALKPVHSLQLLRARPVSLSAGSQKPGGNLVAGQPQIVISSASTLGEALWEGGIQLFDQDLVDPGLDSPLESAETVSLIPSQSLSVRYRGSASQVRSSAETVGAALAGSGLPLQGMDYSVPGPAASLHGNGDIRIVRVQESLILEQEPLPFENQYQPDPNLDLDSQVVIQPGVMGMKTRRIRVRTENGREASRIVETEFVSQPPQVQILGVGTKISLKTLNTPSGPIKYWRSKTVYATSYSPCRIFKDRCDSVTASGATLQKGIAAVTGEWYRYLGGTQIYVPGYGIATIADVGGGIPGQAWIDLGYSDNDYVSWHQTVTVYFLAPAPAEVPWILR